MLPISRRVNRNSPDISFDSNSLEFSDKISMLGVWGLTFLGMTPAKDAACKLGLLFRTRRYFRSGKLLTPYEAKFVPVSNTAIICGECHTGCNSEASNLTNWRPDPR